MNLLRRQKREQALAHLKADQHWQESGLVFTNELGQHLTAVTVYNDLKKIAVEIGLPDLRFHDLRHSYAVAAIRAGDDWKTISGNLGDATMAFPIDKYGHYTKHMKRDSSERMNDFMEAVLGM